MAAVHVGDLAGGCQAQTCALVGVRSMQALEQLEYPLMVPCRNANTIVGYLVVNHILVALAGNGDDGCDPFTMVFQPIGDKILKNELQEGLVAIAVGAGPELDAAACTLQQCAQFLANLLQYIVHRHFVLRKPLLSA